MSDMVTSTLIFHISRRRLWSQGNSGARIPEKPSPVPALLFGVRAAACPLYLGMAEGLNRQD